MEISKGENIINGDVNGLVINGGYVVINGDAINVTYNGGSVTVNGDEVISKTVGNKTKGKPLKAKSIIDAISFFCPNANVVKEKHTFLRVNGKNYDSWDEFFKEQQSKNEE